MKRVGRPPKVRPPEDADLKPKRKSSPSRSPGRRKASPDYKPPGRRSPARKSPARKSPGRPPKQSPTRVNVAKKSPKSPEIKLSYVKIKSMEFDRDEVRLGESKNGVDINDGQRSLRERKPRLTDYQARRKVPEDVERWLNLAQNTPLPKRSTKESQHSDLSEDDDIPNVRKLSTPHDLKNAYADFAGPISAFLNIFFGVVVLFVCTNIACNGQPCTFTALPKIGKYSTIKSWFTLRSVVAVLCLHLMVLLFSMVPIFGKRMAMPASKNSFVANGLFSLLAIGIVLILIERFYYPISTIIYEDFVQLEIASLILSLLFAATTFIRGERAPHDQRNPNANTGSRLYDFCMGRELNPVLLRRFPIKVLLFRFMLIGLVIINVTWMCRNASIQNFPTLTTQSLLNTTTYINIYNSFSISPTLVLFSMMQIIYCVDYFVREAEQIFTFEFMHEGVGFFVCSITSLYPFFPTIITKRLLDQNISYSNYVLVATILFYICGFYIYHKSNFEKNTFRKNPSDPRIAHLQTMPTFQGKKLLISGWWGCVRHPNYLGDLMMHTAWGVGAWGGLSLIPVFVAFLVLIGRTQRDGKLCSEKYGSAWKRYCQKVPYCLVPKLY